METPVIAWLLANWGKTGGVTALALLLLVRFLPQYLINLRERRLADAQRRLADKAEITNRERSLFERLDRKDAVLEKLTGNHIQHLEVVLAKSDAFHDAAVEHLRAMTTELREARGELLAIRAKVDDIHTTTKEIRAVQ